MKLAKKAKYSTKVNMRISVTAESLMFNAIKLKVDLSYLNINATINGRKKLVRYSNEAIIM